MIGSPGSGFSTLESLASVTDIAEVTLCFLMERSSREAYNVFTLVRFLYAPLHTSLRNSVKLTERPQTVRDCKELQFGAKRFYFQPAHVASALSNLSDTLELVGEFERVRVGAPGEWHHPIAVEPDEHHTSAYVPRSSRRLRWQIERWSATTARVVQLAGPSRRDVWFRTQATLKVPVPYERLGNILTTVETPLSLRVITSSDARRLGLHVIGARPEGAMAVVELQYRDEGRSTSIHELTSEFSDLPVAGPAERCTVSLYARDGALLCRRTQPLEPRREIKVRSESFLFDPNARNVSVNLPDDPAPISTRVEWQSQQLDPRQLRHEWDTEVQMASARRAQETLMTQKKLILYVGGPDERTRAVADLRSILGQYGAETVQIWDPYFCARDAVEFLTALRSSNTEIRILTGCKANDANLAYVKQWLKKPGPGIPPLTRVEFRFDVGPSHDRFLLRDGSCWQLGCSFNHIGANVSTIVEWPISEPVQAAFEVAWSQAKR